MQPRVDKRTPPVHASVDVWYAPLGPIADAREREQLAWLDDDERARLGRRRTKAARREYRVAHALLRLALSRHRPVDPGAWRFEAGDHGRPELSSPPDIEPLSFNLSHTRDLVACVVAEGMRVGIDVECAGRNRDIEKLAGRTLTPAERANLFACPEPAREDRFLDYWTLKEAHLKAIGEGIARPMRAIELRLLGEDTARSSLDTGIPDRGMRWHYRRVCPSPRHRMAIAAESDSEVVFRIAELIP